MKRVVKRATIVILVLATLTILFVTCAWLLAPESGLLSNSVENFLTRTLGLKVTVASSRLSYSFPSVLSISLVGLEIKDDHKNLMFSAEAVVLSPSLRSLLRKELIIESVSVTNFWTLISRDQQGKLSAPVISAFEPKALDPGRENDDTNKPSTADNNISGWGKIENHPIQGVGWKVQAIKFTNGRVDWIDRQGNPDDRTVISLSDIHGSLAHSNMDQMVSIELTSAATDKHDHFTNVSLHGQIDVDWTIPRVRSAKLNILSKSQQLGVFSDYLSHVPVMTKINRWELSARLSLEETSDLDVSLDATIFVGDTKTHEFKLTSSGTVKAPLSDSTHLDLSVKVFSNPNWPESIFSSENNGFRVNGPLALKARIKGAFDSLNIDTEIDCKKTSLSFESPFFKYRINTKKALVNLTTRRLGHRDFALKGNGTFNLNIEDPEVLDRNIQENFHIEGEAPIVVKFNGDYSKIEWSFVSDLTQLFVSSINGFRKQVGKKSSLEAVGSYSDSVLTIQKAIFVTPGLSLKAGGALLDAKRCFGRLVVDAEMENIASIFPQDVTVSKLGISGGVKASLIIRNSPPGLIESGRIHLTDVHCKPEKAAWNLQHIAGSLDFKAQTLTITGLTGTVNGHIQAPFKVTGSLKNVGSPSAMTGKVFLKVDRGKVKSDWIVQILTEAHSILGNMIKPRPVSMQGDFIHFDQVLADIFIKSGRATTQNLQMRGNEIISSAIGSVELDSFKLDATMGINTKVVGSDTLEAVPLIGELMQRHRDILLRIPVTVFARLSGPILSQIDVKPVQEQQLDKLTLEKLRALISAHK